MKNDNYVIKNIMKPKGLKGMNEGGPIKDWWDDRFTRRRNRGAKKSNKASKNKMQKQCDFNKKNPMCKRRR